MNNKQLIETLKNIKEHCKSNKCSNCRFKGAKVEYFDCLVVNILNELSTLPKNWNIEKLEELINEIII